MELDDFLMKRTVCIIIDSDERFAPYIQAAGQLTNVEVKIVKTLGAETQSVKWGGKDIVLLDTTTIEYANNIFDVMMSEEAAFSDRYTAMQSLLYKQWARSFFISGYTLQSWLVLHRGRTVDDAISFRDDTTCVSRHVKQNIRSCWQSIFAGFILGHELGHALHKRGDLDEERYDRFLTAHARGTEGVNGLREELLCDLYACEFLLRCYDVDNYVFAFSLCYVLPICIGVINFLKAGVKNRWWVEYLRTTFEMLRREYGQAEASRMMTTVVKESIPFPEGEVEDITIRMFAVSDFMLDGLNRKREGAVDGSEQPQKQLDRAQMMPVFFAREWVAYQRLFVHALEETDTLWLDAIFSDAEDAETAANHNRFNPVAIGLPCSEELSAAGLKETARQQFLRENGF
jgi:hypothetical protein